MRGGLGAPLDIQSGSDIFADGIRWRKDSGDYSPPYLRATIERRTRLRHSHMRINGIITHCQYLIDNHHKHLQPISLFISG